MKDKLTNNVVLISVSKLTPEDWVMGYLPKTDAERGLMTSLVHIITETNPKNDFYCFVDVPLPSADGTNYYEWQKISKEMAPGQNSRIGAKSDYVLLLGVLLKAIIDKGWDEAEAWNAICDNPKKILESNENWPEILLLKSLLNNRIMLECDSGYNIAFHVVDTSKSLFRFIDIEYQISEYDYAVENYFNDYTFPCTESPFQHMLDGLSGEAPDVKADKWKTTTALIIMDAN
ncbi:MAG: hypothetical protein E7314_06580 [Clostridiales bacterium]|nr:hypothetical protein [Clostridiales bacterium]